MSPYAATVDKPLWEVLLHCDAAPPRERPSQCTTGPGLDLLLHLLLVAWFKVRVQGIGEMGLET